ncbi:unnamed protein product, partial [Mesorhabditis spiculigera]
MFRERVSVNVRERVVGLESGVAQGMQAKPAYPIATPPMSMTRTILNPYQSARAPMPNAAHVGEWHRETPPYGPYQDPHHMPMIPRPQLNTSAFGSVQNFNTTVAPPLHHLPMLYPASTVRPGQWAMTTQDCDYRDPAWLSVREKQTIQILESPPGQARPDAFYARLDGRFGYVPKCFVKSMGDNAEPAHTPTSKFREQLNPTAVLPLPQLHIGDELDDRYYGAGLKTVDTVRPGDHERSSTFNEYDCNSSIGSSGGGKSALAKKNVAGKTIVYPKHRSKSRDRATSSPRAAPVPRMPVNTFATPPVTPQSIPPSSPSTAAVSPNPPGRPPRYTLYNMPPDIRAKYETLKAAKLAEGHDEEKASKEALKRVNNNDSSSRSNLKQHENTVKMAEHAMALLSTMRACPNCSSRVRQNNLDQELEKLANLFITKDQKKTDRASRSRQRSGPPGTNANNSKET